MAFLILLCLVILGDTLRKQHANCTLSERVSASSNMVLPVQFHFDKAAIYNACHHGDFHPTIRKVIHFEYSDLKRLCNKKVNPTARKRNLIYYHCGNNFCASNLKPSFEKFV